MLSLFRVESQKLWRRRSLRLLLLAMLIYSLILFVNGLYVETNVSSGTGLDDFTVDTKPAEQTDHLPFAEGIQKRIDNEKKKLLLSMFDNPWQQARTRREIELLEPLAAITESTADDRGYKAIFESPFESVFLFILLWILLDALFFDDDRLRITDLQHVTATGSVRLFGVKLTVLAWSLFFVALLFAGVPIAVGTALGRLPAQPVQMVSGYEGVYLAVSARAFAVLLAAGRFLTLLAFGLFLLFLMRLFGKPALALTVFAAVLAMFAGMYYFISPGSRFILFRYLNPIAFLSPADGLTRLQLFNVFARPVTFAELWLASVVLVILILIPASFRANRRAMSRRTLTAKGTRTRRAMRSDFAHHISIVTIVQRSGIVLLVFLLLFGYRIYESAGKAENFFAAEHAAMRIYGGEMNEANKAAIDAREKEALRLLEAMRPLAQNPDRTETESQSLATLTAEYDALPAKDGFSQMLYTLNQRQLEGKKWLLPERGPAFIFGVHHDMVHRTDFLLAGVIYVLFIVHAYDFFFQDRRHDMLMAAPRGRHVFFRQLLVVLLTGAVFFVLVPEMTRLITTDMSQPLMHWGAPVSEISTVPSALPLWLLFIIRILLSVALFAALGILALVTQLRSSRELALAAGSGAVLIIWLLYELGATGASLFSLTTFALIRQPRTSVLQAIVLFGLIAGGTALLRRTLTCPADR